MTEREKMLAGHYYDSRDDELIAMYWRVREVLQKFNVNIQDRSRMNGLRTLLEGVEPDVWIEPPFYCEYGVNIRISSGSYLNVNCFLQDCAYIKIGKNVLLGPGVQICTASHPLNSSDRIVDAASYVTYARPVTIGDRVWIGANVTVLGGITIGDDTVIGSGSIVIRDIPSGVVAYGVPCRPQQTNAEQSGAHQSATHPEPKSE